MFRIQVMHGAMLSIAALQNEIVAEYGLDEKPFQIFQQETPWLGKDRHAVKRTLETITYGSMDLMGYARFEAPAEYIAGIIAAFVKPVNFMTACHISGSMTAAEEIAGGTESKLKPKEIFANVCMAMADESIIKAVMEKKATKSLNRAEKVGTTEKS